MPRLIEYVLEGHGWAQGAIVLSGRRIGLDASYIHDTFKDIVEALLMACKGQEMVERVYFHEPTSTHVHLTLADGRRVISLRRFPGLRVPRPPLGNPGTLVAQGEVVLRQLVVDVILAGSRMIEAHGEQGYQQSWHHPFPTRVFAELEEFRRKSVLL
jgi:hypothetical protein